MNYTKLWARDKDGLTHFLTYADNNAVGYFLKQVRAGCRAARALASLCLHSQACVALHS